MAATQLPSTGRPVAIDIIPRSHALLSASSADRWIACPPSARVEEAMPDRGSSYATDGTAAHAFAELRLRYLLGQNTQEEYVATYRTTRLVYADAIKEWTVTDWEAINAYVRYVLDEADRLDAKVMIEQRVDYSRFAEGGFGTSDALLVSETQGIIKSIDLKFGKGVMVSAHKNAQARLYAIGGFLGLAPEQRKKINTIEWAIVQPRLDHIGEDSMTIEEMKDWTENVVAPAAKLAWEGKGDFKPTEKGCQFCKARATCRARAADNVLIARKEFTKFMDKDKAFSIDLGESQMTIEDIARILPHLAQWKAWANALDEHALKVARDDDVDIPGYKLVRGRALRRWAKGHDEVADTLKTAGIDDAVIYEPQEHPIRSVAQMEKAMGKKDFAAFAPLLVETPPGTPALVPETDPREPMNKAREAARDFGISKAKKPLDT